MNDKTTPRNRDEEEILGYRNVLSLVHENYDAIPVRPNYILQMHRDLLRFTYLTYGGSFKTAPNEIDMILGDGKKVVLFKPLEPMKLRMPSRISVRAIRQLLRRKLFTPSF